MSKSMNKPVIILGGGISGLSAAWYLHKAGIPFYLFEKNEKPGGVIQSENRNGTILDYGPNTIRDRTGDIREFVRELGLEDQMVTVSESFKTRYIVRNRQLQKISPNPVSFFRTNILSGKAKLRLMAEPFIPGAGNDQDESIGDFLERRLGKEAVEYLADPVFSGIYAGNIYELSKDALLPKLADFERNSGSLTWGALRGKSKTSNSNSNSDPDVKPEVLTFQKGVQQLAYAIKDRISSNVFHEEIISINKIDDEYVVSTQKDSFLSKTIISTIPAYNLATIVSDMDKELSEALSSVPYAPILSTQVIYKREETGELPDGFGFLIPRKEPYRLLGAIWKSNIFPENTRDDEVHFTLLTGGDLDHKILDQSISELENEILSEFSSLMNLNARPSLIQSRLWQKAIPQFKVGYEHKKDLFKTAEKKFPGFYIGGNYNWGVSVPDCVRGAKTCVNDLLV